MKFRKTYFDYTEKERQKLAELTPSERIAVDNFIASAKALPKCICIAVDSFGDAPHLTVSKRITEGSCMEVAKLTKKSLCF